MQTLISIKDGYKDDEGVWRAPFAPFEVTRRLAERIRSRDRRVFTPSEWEDYVALGKGTRRTALNAGADEAVASDPDACAAFLRGLLGADEPEAVVLEDAEPEHFVSMTLDLDAMTRDELRDVAAELCLQVGGTKDELRARIEAAHVESFEEE